VLDEEVAAVQLGRRQRLLLRRGSGAPFGEVRCSTVAESLPPPQPIATSTLIAPAARQRAAARGGLSDIALTATRWAASYSRKTAWRVRSGPLR
jgi:hypothetical protein